MYDSKRRINMSKEHWDNSFSDKDFVYGETENEFINHKSNIIRQHSKIGCFAEGEGRNAVYLATLGHDVTAYDQSAVGLEKTNKLASQQDRKSTRLNSSHVSISYAVFCLKKKRTKA